MLMVTGVPPRPAPAGRSYATLPFRRFQVILLVTSLVLVGTSWLIQGRVSSQDLAEYAIFAFIVGNCTRLAALSAARIYGSRRFPWDVLLLLFIQIPACIIGGYVALIVARLAVERVGNDLWSFSLASMLKCIFFSAVITGPVYLSLKRQANLEWRNRDLESQVTLVLLCYKETFWCRIVLWVHQPRQAHSKSALRHT